MRCCARRSWRALLAALRLAPLLLALVAAQPARAEGIEVRGAALVAAEDGYYLEATFDVTLTPALEDALNKGIPLHFLLEFELIRPRWYWLNEKLVNHQQSYRLSYNALTRQYRVGVGNLHQNFASLPEALEVMSRVRRRQEVDPGALRRDTTYMAGVRLRLDTSQLPKPFQLNALGSRGWYVGSDWYYWSVTP